MPTAGAMLILSASPKAYFNRILTWRPLVFIGLISYSLYLWHWPLLAYWNIIDPGHALWMNGILLLVAFVLSILVYRYVETPCRTVRSPRRKKWAVVGLLVGLLLVTGLGQLIRHQDGVEWRNSSYFQTVAAIRDDWTNRDRYHSIKINGAEVEINRPGNFPEILFIGDSHMEQYMDRLFVLADAHDMTIGVVASGGCWVAPGVRSGHERCSKNIQSFEILLKDPRLHHVVVAQKWGGYLENDDITAIDALGNSVSFDRGGWKVALHNLYEAFATSKRTLHVILDVPWDESKTSSNYDPLRRLPRYNTTIGEQDFLVPYPKDDAWKQGNDAALATFQSVATIIAPAEQECPQRTCNLLHYKDDDHLRASYAKDHAVWIDSIFDDVKEISQ